MDPDPRNRANSAGGAHMDDLRRRVDQAPPPRGSYVTQRRPGPAYSTAAQHRPASGRRRMPERIDTGKHAMDAPLANPPRDLARVEPGNPRAAGAPPLPTAAQPPAPPELTRFATAIRSSDATVRAWGRDCRPNRDAGRAICNARVTFASQTGRKDWRARWDLARRSPTPPLLARVAGRMGRRPRSRCLLLGGDGRPPPPPTPAPPPLALPASASPATAPTYAEAAAFTCSAAGTTSTGCMIMCSKPLGSIGPGISSSAGGISTPITSMRRFSAV